MQKHGYDGYSSLGLQKQGITEPIQAIGGPSSLGLGFKLFFLAPLSTTVPSCETLNFLNDEKASEDFPFESNITDSPLVLDYLFSNLDIPSMEDNITTPNPQAPSSSWIDTL